MSARRTRKAPEPPVAPPVAIREPTPPPRLPLPIEVRHVPGGRTTYIVAGRSFDTPRAALDFAGR